jgi:hypothetical protein
VIKATITSCLAKGIDRILRRHDRCHGDFMPELATLARQAEQHPLGTIQAAAVDDVQYLH